MGRILLHHDPASDLPAAWHARRAPPGCDPVGPARGIFGALVISALLWAALGLLLPLVW
ncbi:hypothetical protein [Falsiroseomonas bella]|uniref:hypothetical protein n=1 Tax=Falsiroseomonas bella TaxID=2184016 RepID=UPI0013048FFF|nr:hypothetical protein [Falsiroseomonas bella]